MRHLGRTLGFAFLSLGLAAVVATPCVAAMPEIQGTVFPDKNTLNWAPAPGVEAYNVYRGNVATLRASGGTNYGVCFQSGLLAPAATDGANPAPGQTFIYLINGSIGINEGTTGYTSSGPERPVVNPCLLPPSPLRDSINPNGPQFDGVIQGVEAARNPGIANDLTGLAGGGLYLHTGEYFAQAVDMEIPGRGISWRHVRSYRSQISHNGQQGYNWTFNYDRRVISSAGGISYLDGTGRQDAYIPLGALYEPAEPGVYDKILHNGDGTFTLRERDGTLYHHRPLDGSLTQGCLFAIEDRLGNRINFLYYPSGHLKAAVDTLGRDIAYYWNAQGRLYRVVDYAGRELRYAYDADGNLIQATSPAVTGTSTGNDFPVGRTTTYAYSSGTGDPRLDHNLTSVTAPGDAVPVIQNTYNGRDELQGQFHGGMNLSGVFAGGAFQYQIVPIGGGNRRTVVLDRNLVQHAFTSDNAGHVTLEEVFTTGLRPSDPPVFATQHAYNPTGERIFTILPLSNQIVYAYDEVNPDRFQRGNLVSVTRVADPLRGNGYGGPASSITAHYAYEPLFNQQRVVTDPSGGITTYTFDYQEGDPATNGVAALAATWNISLATVPLLQGDVNGDGSTSQVRGSPVRLVQPSVTLFPGGRQAGIEGAPTQPVVTLYRYSTLGQLVVEIDPELNVTVHQYHPENDPDGDGVTTPAPIDGRILAATPGGYLAVTTLDADPAPYLTPTQVARRDNATNPAATAIRNDFLYNSTGNLVRSIDGVGTATIYEVNQQNQIVSVRRGAVSSRATDLSTDPPLAGFVSQQIYNARGEIVSRRVEDLGDLSGTGGFVDTDFVHDILGHQVSMSQEIGNGVFAVTAYRWDAQGNRVATIFPEGNVFTMQPDERGLLLRLVRGDDDLTAANGGPPTASVQVYNYDANGNPTEFIDGRGQPWAMTYTGHDQCARADVVPEMSFFDVYWGPNELPVEIRVTENVGPGIIRYQAIPVYDELGRVKEIREAIRNAAGNLLLEDANADGFVSRVTEFDRNGRRSRVRSDSGKTQDFDYDGAGRLVRKADQAGNTAVFVYDDGNNLTQTTETDIGSTGAETFQTASVYDRLGRLRTTTDGLGNSKSLVHDSRDNLRLLTDAKGNTIAYERNGLNRLSKIVRDMRAGGGAPGGVIGQLVYQYVADHNGRLTAAIDPNGRATTYAYDALDRLVRETFADETTTDYGYDGNDNVTSVVDANGSFTAIQYDIADRPIQRVSSPAPGAHAITQSFGFDAMNRLTSAVDQNDVGPPERTDVQFTYDSLNKIRSERSQFGLNPPVALSFAYNGEGHRTSAIYPGGFSLNYSYNALNLLQSINSAVAGFSASYTYIGNERVAQRGHGNGTRKSYLGPTGTTVIGYDGARRVQAIRHYNATNTALASFDYTRDAAGNLTSEKRNHQSGKGDVWLYDSAYRVVGFKQDVDNPIAELNAPGTGGPIRNNVVYVLDPVGNRIQKLVNGIGRQNTPNNLNEYDELQSGGTRIDDGIPDDFGDLTSTPFPDGTNLGHDRNGDLTREGNLTYEYDTLHRLHTVRNGGAPVAHYVYDGLNRLIAKQDIDDGIGTRFVWDGDRIVLERDYPEATTRRRFFPGIDTEIVAMQLVGTGTLYYLHEDVKGSTVMLTGPGATVVERVTYDDDGTPEFRDAANNLTGATQSTVGNPFLYQGQLWHPETQLYDRRGAMFAPRFGRHLQRFVPGQHVGPLGSAFNPPMLFPCPFHWIGMNPFWWGKAWFWHPGAWFAGWWAWKPFWWWGGAWGWWWWQPWLWFGIPGFGWWIAKPWVFWWHAPFNWWGWQTWWVWPGWWGCWPYWGWFGWTRWLPVWGWLSWHGWWPWWHWWGWWGWWPACGWWGWWGWWPWWNVWWGWHPWWWWGWWTWTPYIWHGFWGWSGLSLWWNWWHWIRWWPWGWWHWLGWWGWWGWWGWNPWWLWGWGGWWYHGWIRGWYWWWGPFGWWPWFCWGWWPWWWCGWWGWQGWIWGCWIWRLVWGGFWNWGWWWGWSWGWWSWPFWGWYLWWGWWWPWWGWWA